MLFRSDQVVFGEVGLGGEIRPVSQANLRLREAAKLGFATALAPRSRRGDDVQAVQGLSVSRPRRLIDVAQAFLSETTPGGRAGNAPEPGSATRRNRPEAA